MIETRYWCERCCERITPGDRFSYRPTSGGKRHDPDVDLCGACEAEFRQWLGPGPGRVQTTEEIASLCPRRTVPG